MLALSVACGTTGCTPTAEFYGEQALRASVAGPAEFEAQLRQAADDAGHRLVVAWDPSAELTTAWLEAQLTQPRAPVIILSPYFSLFASDFADRHENLEFIAFGGGGSERPNLTRVVFDRGPALERAGTLVRSWEEAGEGRKAAVLYLTDSEVRQTELDILLASHDEEGSRAIDVVRYDRAPDRETVRREIRDLRANDVNAFLVFVGASNRFALELLQSEPVVFATDFAQNATSLGDALLFTIEERVPAGVLAALRRLDTAEHGVLVTVLAVVEVGSGYENPQLGRSESNPGSDDAQSGG